MKIIDINSISTSEAVDQAISVLVAGGLIIYPTETVYGAGVDATNQVAVDKLLAYKSRREGKPLSVAVKDLAMAEQYVKVNNQAQTLYQQFLPGPMTIISQGKGQLADGVESEFGTLGIRIPDHPLILEILKQLGRPITATSANSSGQARPYSVESLLKGLSENQKSKINLILDAGLLTKNPPSTVIDTTHSTPITFRQGEINIKSDLSKKANWDEHSSEVVSESEQETIDLAGKIMLKHWGSVKSHGLVIGLNGPLGAGKTIFTKGVARFLQISEVVNSPTYTYHEEYSFERHGVTGQLHHLDLWKVDQLEMLQRLEIEQLLGANRVVVIEWWSQGASQMQKMVEEAGAGLVLVEIADLGENSRQVSIQEVGVNH